MRKISYVLAGLALSVGGFALYARSKKTGESAGGIAPDRAGAATPDYQLDEKGLLESIADGARKVAASITIPTGAEVIQTLRTWIIPSAGQKYKALFDAATQKYGLPAGLLARQAYQESRFREDIITGKVVSSAGAVGIMQIIPKWHPSLDPGDAAADLAAALDPPRAIDYAARYLKKLHGQFGSWQLALAAYNAGPGNVQKYAGVPPFTETRNYVTQISSDIGLMA